jgi:hypothetical protein
MSEINEDDEEQMPSMVSPMPLLISKATGPGTAPGNFKSILKTSVIN